MHGAIGTHRGAVRYAAAGDIQSATGTDGCLFGGSFVGDDHAAAICNRGAGKGGPGRKNIPVAVKQDCI